jgi:phenylacetate-CoA ligase
MLDPGVEALAPAGLAALQEERFAAQWERLRAIPATRARVGAAADRPCTLDGLVELPLTDKEELRASQEAQPPFGDYLGVAEEAIVRVHRTSGLSGRGMTLAYTDADARATERVGARSMVAAGLRRADRVVHCLNYCLWTGGVTDHMILEAAGATTVPFGVGSTRALIDVIRELGVSGIQCTPSYPALIEKVLREETDLEPRDLGLRIALFGGEAGLDNPGFRERLEETWGFVARNANFGLSEVLSILGGQCEHTGDLHFHAGDVVFAELLDPQSRQRIAVAEGASGELVCTHLVKEAQPLLRYATRDVVTVTGTGPCACGRTSFRFRVSGRTDDMFNVRGVNVFPSAVRRVVDAHPALASGQLRIVLRGAGPYDRIELRAEAAAALPADAFAPAAAELADAIRAAIRASAAVELVPYGSLPRTAMKTSWVERVPE